MLSKKMEEALNAQVNAEFWSAYLYLSMSNHFAAAGNQGFANWFSIQFQEEQAHATIFMKYVLSCGGKVTLAPIAGVKTEWKSPLEAFEDTLAHERKVTALIHDLCVLADEEKDFGTANMLKWFVDEQIEEEANAQELIDSLKMIKDNGFGLYMLDKELIRLLPRWLHRPNSLVLYYTKEGAPQYAPSFLCTKRVHHSLRHLLSFCLLRFQKIGDLRDNVLFPFL